MAADPAAEAHSLVASDKDFADFIAVCDSTDASWELVLDQDNIKLWKKAMSNSSINSLKLCSFYPDVEPEVAYDVLHDHYFRREWDNNMIEGSIVEQVDGFNEVGYYAAKMPATVSNRDFCNHRAWRAFPDRNEWVIFNRSVVNDKCPPCKGFVRGWSFLGGYLLRKRPEGGTNFMFYSQSDPKGWLPSWLVNWVMNKLTPSMIKTLHENCLKYPEWKKTHKPEWKPWLLGYDVNEEPYCRHKAK